MRQGIFARMTGNVVSVQPIRTVGRGREAQQVLNFRLAANNYAPPGTPQEEQTASFVNVSAWNHDVAILAQYLFKGKPLTVEGTLELKPYESKQYPGVRLIGADLRMRERGFEFISSGRRPDAAQDVADTQDDIAALSPAVEAPAKAPATAKPAGTIRRSRSTKSATVSAAVLRDEQARQDVTDLGGPF